MTSCRMCGHESHCGSMLKKDLDGSGEEIQVCYSCLCELCDENSKRQS